MNFLKSALAMFAFLAVGIGTGLLVRVGIGATADRGSDIQWFDRDLVGAKAATAPAMLLDQTCPDCSALLDDSAAESASPADEARRIAERLDLQAVPLFVANGRQITRFDPDLLDARFGAGGSR